MQDPGPEVLGQADEPSTELSLGAWLSSAELFGPSFTADWANWIDRGKAPGGPAAGWPVRTEEHLGLLKAMDYRTIVVGAEWARLQPGPREHSHVESEALENLLTLIRSYGLSPWLCLVDGTLPGWFSVDEKGFDDRKGRGLIWPRHVDWVAETFGHLVDGWIPQREPIRRVLRSHLLGIAPPGGSDRARTARAVGNVILADGEAWRLLAGSQPVMMNPTAQLFSAHPEMVKAKPYAAWLNELVWDSWNRALTDGVVRVADGERTEAAHLRDGFDGVVAQVRRPVRIEASKADPAGEWTYSPMPLIDAHYEAASRVKEIGGSRHFFVSGDLAQVPEDGKARANLLGSMIGVSDELGAERFLLTSPIDGWHWEHGSAATPGVIDRSGEARES